MQKSKKPARGKAGRSIEALVPMSVDARQQAMAKIAAEMSLWRPANTSYHPHAIASSPLHPCRGMDRVRQVDLYL